MVGCSRTCYFRVGVAGGNRAYPSHLVRLQAVVQPVARLLESVDQNIAEALKRERPVSHPQNRHGAVEIILASGNGTRIGVLPENVALPPICQSAEGADVANDPQWAVGGEPGAGMVSVGEILDPAVAFKPQHVSLSGLSVR